MTRISQLIAVAGGLKEESRARFAQLKNIAGNPELMAGRVRTYQPKADNGARQPDQSQLVRVTAAEVLTLAEQMLTRKWDVVATLDAANAGAFADVVVNGGVLLPRVPVGHLLWLAKELAELKELVEALPVLDNSKDWSPAGAGVVKSAPVETFTTEKVPYSFTLGEPTREHAGQYQLMTRDEVSGTWTTVALSGAVTEARKRVLLDRVTVLSDAVKMAREEANSAQVTDVKEGKVIFEWLLR